MRENLPKNVLVVIECKNPFGMPITYKKKVSERELKELRSQEDLEIVSVKKLSV